MNSYRYFNYIGTIFHTKNISSIGKLVAFDRAVHPYISYIYPKHIIKFQHTNLKTIWQ
jgi:hypothetical protein